MTQPTQQTWPSKQRFVIELTNVEDPQVPTRHYGYRLRHLGVGTPNERVTYWVINGGFTAGVYKDGRRTVNGKFFPNWPSGLNPLVAVTKFVLVDTHSPDYNEVILNALHKEA